MKFQVKRIFLGETYTIGKLSYFDGSKWVYFCDTLEDKVRDLNKDGDLNDIGETKIYGETAIPYGKYSMIVSYSPKFQRDLPLLLNVNGFEYIRIHSGNTATDSHGCILLGFNKEKGKVLESKKTLENFMSLLNSSKDKTHEIEII
jgi:hypothetical protein